MKTLSFPSLCKRAVALFVLMAGLCVSIHAETRWTKSMFVEKPMTPEMVPGAMAPMTAMAKNESGIFYFAIRTYLGAPLPNPIKVTFTIYGFNNVPYYSGTAVMHETIEYPNLGYNMLSGTSGQWIRLDHVNGAVVPYYSVDRVFVRLLLIGPNAGDYSTYFFNAPFYCASSVSEMLESCGLKDPSHTLGTFRSVTLPTSEDF